MTDLIQTIAANPYHPVSICFMLAPAAAVFFGLMFGVDR